jgi:hypothetical protein
MPRYRTTGLPPAAANGATAFAPHFNRLAGSGAMEYKAQVEGQPGTMGIPVAGSFLPVPSPDLGDIAQMGYSRSSDAPNMIYPNQYWTTPEPAFWPGAGMPIQMYDPVRPQDTTMIPVPAVNPVGYYRHNQDMDAAVVQEAGGMGAITQMIRGRLSGWPKRQAGQGNA